MRITSGAARVVLASGLLLALSGCGFGPAVVHPSASPSAHPTPRPTVTATPAALTAPRSSLALGCAGVLPLPTAAGAFPVSSGIALRVSENSVPDGVFEVSNKQAGGLHCIWGGTQSQDDSFTDRISFDEIGGAADDYQHDVVPDSSDQVNAFGTASTSSCSGDPQFACRAQVLVGARWFELDYDSLGGEDEPSSGSDDRFSALVTGIVQRMQASDVDRTLWVPPTGWDGHQLCEDAATARVSTATGFSDRFDTDESDAPPDAQSVAVTRVGVQACAWARSGSDEFNLRIDFVPGGGWTAAQEVMRPPSHDDGTLAPVTIAGATSAVAVCNGELCRADMAVGGGWLSVEVDGFDTLTQLTTDVAALLAATPR